MPRIQEGMKWFKNQFGTQIQNSINGTPFSLDLLTAIAMQETYYIWGNLYTRLSVDEVLKLCVGDTLDTPNRSAFPKNKAALLTIVNGDNLFAVAREALESVGEYIAAYGEVAHHNPNKFCHGFGIFQYDIQFCKENPEFFLQKRWYSFDECLKLSITELKAALKRAYGSHKTTLTDKEMVYVAIAYNAGSVNISGSFKQGYKDDSGKYYGEHIWEYLQMSKNLS